MRQLFAFVVGAVALAALNPAPARAQGLATTTFVSGFGLDTNSCTVAAPCRSFQHAHDVTAAGGQITMLDPAGYGRLTIGKAISIVNDGGGEAGINDPGTGVDAIDIRAGPGDVVNLRGLTLDGVGTGAHGVLLISGGALNIQNCVMREFQGTGVNVQPTASASVTISDTITLHNGAGVVILATSGTITAQLRRVAAIGNTSEGFLLDGISPGTVRVTIVDSVALESINPGFNQSGHFGFEALGNATVTLINSKSINNGTGLSIILGATMTISQTTVQGNTIDGFSVDGSSTLQTFGDNYIVDATNSGTLTPIAAQ